MVHDVAVLAADGVNTFELAVVGEIFGSEKTSTSIDWYRYAVCGPDDRSIALSNGMVLQLSHGLERALQADTVIVPAWIEPSQTYDERLLDVLRSARSNGARIVSMCTGAFVLASAGLLDNRPATTHWQHIELLHSWYPTIDIRNDQLYVDDGDILTSAGSSAAIDLSLHIVSCDFGAAVSADVARRLVLAPHRSGGQTQFAIKPKTRQPQDPTVSIAMQFALSNIAETLRIEDLARSASTSSRTLIRQFDAVTGQSPMRWLTQQRVEQAKLLLETTSLSISRIASEVGLGSPANFRVHFGREVGVAPSQYRQTFGITHEER